MIEIYIIAKSMDVLKNWESIKTDRATIDRINKDWETALLWNIEENTEGFFISPTELSVRQQYYCRARICDIEYDPYHSLESITCKIQRKKSREPIYISIFPWCSVKELEDLLDSKGYLNVDEKIEYKLPGSISSDEKILLGSIIESVKFEIKKIRTSNISSSIVEQLSDDDKYHYEFSLFPKQYKPFSVVNMSRINSYNTFYKYWQD
jgi:hypothetical protein